jgi:glycosyltransferase involved in cell wall biosynthesis
MNAGAPLISAVIPTRNRPELVVRAVRSALKQTLCDFEVVVIVDGPDQATVGSLAEIDDRRLRVIALPESVGGSDARNAGVQAARGEWVAFLDDDDEWLPEKLFKQLATAMQSGHKFPVVSSRFIARKATGDFLFPRRAPASGEALADYLFTRRSLFRSEGQIQTSVVFTKRELLLQVPFTSGLRRHQDTEWYVRIGVTAGVGVEFIAEPLAIVYVDENRPRIGNRNDWTYSLAWLQSIKHLISRRAYAGFIAVQLGTEAHAQGDFRAFVPLLKTMCIQGSPTTIELLHYCATWAVPVSARKALRKHCKW